MRRIKIVGLISLLLLSMGAFAQSASEETEKETEEIFMIVDQMPEYPGGNGKLIQFMSSHLEYPAEAVEKGIEGKVFVRFVVEKDGRITNVKVPKSLHPLLDKAAIEMVKQMPIWKPGMKDGKPVRVQYILPVNFKLQ